MNLTPAVRNLLFANIGLLAVPYFMGRLEIFQEMLGLHSFLSPYFSAYQLVTHMFMHAGFQHLLFNMLGLVFFGSWLEQAWGTNRFLLFYFVCGIGAGLLFAGVNYLEMRDLLADRLAFLTNPDADSLANFLSKHYSSQYQQNLTSIEAFGRQPDSPIYQKAAYQIVGNLVSQTLNAPMIGASGAIYGIMAAFALMFPNVEMFVFPLPFPIRAKYVVIFFGISSLFGALHPTPGDNVAHYAHLGGMLFGFLMVRAYNRQGGK